MKNVIYKICRKFVKLFIISNMEITTQNKEEMG